MCSSPVYETVPCPVTCFPYVWGMYERYVCTQTSALPSRCRGNVVQAIVSSVRAPWAC